MSDTDYYIASFVSAIGLGVFWFELGRILRPDASRVTRYPNWMRALLDIPERLVTDPRDHVTQEETAKVAPLKTIFRGLLTGRLRHGEGNFFKRFYRAINYFLASLFVYIFTPLWVYGDWTFGRTADTAVSGLLFLASAILVKVCADLRIKRIEDYVIARRNRGLSPDKN